MMAPLDEAALRRWLVDYLITNIGCSPDDIDFRASLKDLGVASREAVVLSGELSELLDISKEGSHRHTTAPPKRSTC